MEDAAEDLVGTGHAVTGILGGIQAVEQALLETAKELRAARFVDRANASDASVAAKELDEARSGIERSRMRLETTMRQTATPLREAREKAWELRTLCEGTRRPNADCRALLRAFPDSELTSWTTTAALEQAALRVERMSVKDAGTARELAALKTKLDKAAAGLSKLDNFQTHDKEQDEALDSHMKSAKDAMAHVRERCGAATKLLPTDWVAAPSGTDPRKLTVLIYGLLPEPMRPIFDPNATKKGDLTSGSTGSGVIVVRRIAGKPRVFVVTNRHVVNESTRTKVVVDGMDKSYDAHVAYVDPHNDIAILEMDPDEDGKTPFESGVSLETNSAADQQTVVAAGFPGMGGRPSYQVTRGYISNHEVRAGGSDVTSYIQHTAPIDPGSSGGPLLSERGRLLGVNTLKLRGREAVALAVPAEIVADALRAIESAPVHTNGPHEARLACLATLGALAAKGTVETGRRLSPVFVAEAGPPAFVRMSKTGSNDDQEAIAAAYRRDPLGTLRWAALGRLQESIRAAGGVSELEMCENVTMSTSGDDAAARFIIQTVRGPRELKMIRERGEWTVASFDLRDVPAKSVPNAGAKKTVSDSRKVETSARSH